MLVEERTIIGTPDPNYKFDRFMGTVGVGIDTPMGRRIEQVEFTILADTLEEAFVKFKDSVKVHFEMMKVEADKQILVANQMPKIPNRKKLII
jgi:hypothetical protein